MHRVFPSKLSATGITSDLSSQLLWYIDPVGGNDNNDGRTAATALATGAEFSERTAGQYWNGGVYQIHVLGSLVAPDYLNFTGIRFRNSTIIVHGSDTPGQAPVANVLYTSVAGMTARTTQVRGTQTRSSITDAAVPTGTWAGANLISSAATTNKRIRLTDGALPKAIAWPQKSGAAGLVSVSQWLTPYALNAALTVASPAEFAVAGNEHFVVESLVQIDMLILDIKSIDDSSVNTSGFGILLDSLSLPLVVNRGGSGFFCWGCANLNPVNATSSNFGNGNLGAGVRMSHASHHSNVGGSNRDGTYEYAIGFHATGSFNVRQGGWLSLDGDGIAQGVPLLSALQQGGTCTIGSAAAFDSTSDGVQIRSPGGISFVNGAASYGFLLWGNGNAGVGIRVEAGANVVVPTGASVPSITGTGGDFQLGGNLTAIGRTAAGVATAALATTWANLTTAQVAGFGGSARNEITSSSLSIANF